MEDVAQGGAVVLLLAKVGLIIFCNIYSVLIVNTMNKDLHTMNKDLHIPSVDDAYLEGVKHTVWKNFESCLYILGSVDGFVKYVRKELCSSAIVDFDRVNSRVTNIQLILRGCYTSAELAEILNKYIKEENVGKKCLPKSQQTYSVHVIVPLAHSNGLDFGDDLCKYYDGWGSDGSSQEHFYYDVPNTLITNIRTRAKKNPHIQINEVDSCIQLTYKE